MNEWEHVNESEVNYCCYLEVQSSSVYGLAQLRPTISSSHIHFPRIRGHRGDVWGVVFRLGLNVKCLVMLYISYFIFCSELLGKGLYSPLTPRPHPPPIPRFLCPCFRFFFVVALGGSGGHRGRGTLARGVSGVSHDRHVSGIGPQAVLRRTHRLLPRPVQVGGMG